MMIPVFRPSYGDEEIRALAEVVKSGWVGQGPKVEEFERLFAAFLGGGVECLAVDSCSAALTMAVRALCPPGGEVITTPLTFVSTNHAILRNGSVPVFCDIEPDTLNMDADKIEPLITEKTAAIMAVHYGGHACDMDRITGLAARHGLKVIEDAAHACGSEYKGKALGAIGDIGCFSFHAVKNVAVGKGGMLAVRDGASQATLAPQATIALMGTLRKLRWLGIDRDTWERTDRGGGGYSWEYDVDCVSDNFTLSDLAAAIGIVQLGKLEKTNARRREIAGKYNEAFAEAPRIETPAVKEYATKMSHHNYVIKVPERDALHKFLKEKGISTSVHYAPNNRFEVYREFRGETPVADDVWRRLLTLPLFPGLTDEEVELIVSSVIKKVDSRQ